jgi:hypothetical protein
MSHSPRLLAALLLTQAIVVGPAWATSPSAGLWLPGAADTEGDHGGVSVSGGAAVLFTPGAAAAWGGSLSGWYAGGPDEAFVVQGSFFNVTRTVDGATGLYALGSVRYEVLHREKVSLAPWFGAVAQAQGDILPADLVLAAGLAGEVGMGKARLDYSVPLLMVPTANPGQLYAGEDGATNAVALAIVTADLGVSFSLGERDRLRLGKALFVPEIAWRHDFGPVFLDVGLAAWLVLNEAHLAVGAEF